MKKESKNKAQKKIETQTKQVSSEKKRLFQILLVVLPVLFLALFEFGLHIFEYGENTDLFISIPDETSEYLGVNPNVSKRYFTKIDFLPTPRKDLFLKLKPDNCYRIFVLGGSTTAGFPYGNNLMFTRILHRRLMDTFPDRRIEMVNTAFSAINSYTLLDFTNEIVEQQPDALLIYAGHNEFYGALGVGSAESFGRFRWVVKAYLKLQKYKTFEFVRDIIAGVLNAFSGDNNSSADPTATAMARIVKEQTIPLHSTLYEAGKTQFHENIKEIIKTAHKANIPVLLSEVVSNVREHEPFISASTDTLPAALDLFQQAKQLERNNKFNEARNAYYLAKDLDMLRFRAPQEFNQIIRDLATELNISYVPMQSYFENASPNGLIGTNLMHEHVHPNINGYFLMADAFFETMRKQSFINKNWGKSRIKPSEHYRKTWRYTALDSVYAALSIVQIKGGWPFKTAPGPNLAIQQYKATTKVDSIVLKILQKKGETLESGHIKLAKFYESRNELERAFAEYSALIQIVPYWDLFYQPAVKVLLKMEDYRRALNLLYELLKYQESTYVYKSIGQIHLKLGETKTSISFLEKAVNRSQWDTETLFNLGQAYFLTSQNEKVNTILSHLRKIDPNSIELKKLEALKAKTETGRSQVSTYIAKAREFLKTRELDKAYELLNQSLEIGETAAANELIGEIFLVKGSYKQAIKYLESARQMVKTESPKLLYNLASVYYLTGNFPKAWQTFSTFKQRHPNLAQRGNLEAKIKKAMEKQ